MEVSAGLGHVDVRLAVGRTPEGCLHDNAAPDAPVRDLISSPTTVVTRGSSYENRENLAPGFFASIVRKYEGTRLGRQELEAELLDDTPGALWSRDRIEELRRETAPPAGFRRLVIGIDPSGSGGDEADEVG